MNEFWFPRLLWFAAGALCGLLAGIGLMCAVPW